MNAYFLLFGAKVSVAKMPKCIGSLLLENVFHHVSKWFYAKENRFICMVFFQQSEAFIVVTQIT